MAWSAVACSNFQGFAHLEIVCQFLLIFVRFVYDDFGFCVVYLLLAVLLMLREARVVPVTFFSGRAVFFASGRYGTYGLSYIFGFLRAWTLEFIYARFC